MVSTPVFLINSIDTLFIKSDWLIAYNQYTIACEVDMINPISATDIGFIMYMSA